MESKLSSNRIFRLANSPVVLLVLLLIGADLLISDFKAREDEKSELGLASNETRIPALKRSIESDEKSDVLLFGSSLVVTAFTYPDFKLGLAPMNKLDDSYVQSKLLSKLIQERTGKVIKTINLSCLAATPADALLILDELGKRDKLPKTVIYGIEPRAMSDNLTPVGGALGGKSALELVPHYSSPTILQKIEMSLYKFANPVLPAGLKNNFNQLGVKVARLGDSANSNEVNEVVASHFWQLFGARKYIGNTVQSQISFIFKNQAENIPPTKIECLASEITEQDSKKSNEKPWDRVSNQKIQKQLDQYRGHYLPSNHTKLEKNLVFLQKIAGLCKEKGVHLYLVAMPITVENSKLVPIDTAKGYDSNLAQVAHTFGCGLLDLRSGFEQSDFIDTVHLNAQGGEKLQKRLVSALEGSI
ncbi:MAG: hypothetical protein SFY67_09000 [Candidatus Melainabacteria bacterium]|nr:hypothetical protein [Candidatus Melainabacteria bacterium]